MLHDTPPEDLAAWLRLATEPGLGPIQIHRLLTHFESPCALYCASKDALRARLPAGLATQLALTPGDIRLRQIESALCWSVQPDHHLLTPAHPLYPAWLKEIPDHPVVLYAWGDIDRLRRQAIAIVGARNATADGRHNARAFAHHLSEQGWCVVSGLAHGIDAAAHQGALSTACGAGGTIAVLGTGIDIVYPASHRDLTHKILAQRGLILSEFGLGAPPLAGHFPRRNRIVAGLARGVLVVEAARKSGSLITARLAVEMGREVFAIPGSIHAPLSRGPHALIQQGAKLVETGADILSELGHVNQPLVEPAKPPPRFVSKKISCINDAHTKQDSVQQLGLLDCAHSPVWSAIGYDSITEEVLQHRTNMPPARLQAELLTLELSGCIERRPNGCVARASRTRRHNE